MVVSVVIWAVGFGMVARCQDGHLVSVYRIAAKKVFYFRRYLKKGKHFLSTTLGNRIIYAIHLYENSMRTNMITCLII